MHGCILPDFIWPKNGTNTDIYFRYPNIQFMRSKYKNVWQTTQQTHTGQRFCYNLWKTRRNSENYAEENKKQRTTEIKRNFNRFKRLCDKHEWRHLLAEDGIIQSYLELSNYYTCHTFVVFFIERSWMQH